MNHNQKEGRKRPLASVTTNKYVALAKQAAPPLKTATVRRLEQLLDDDPKKKSSAKKRLKRAQQQQPQEAPPSSSSSFGVFPHRPNSLSVPKPARPPDALAFRGGLAAAPTFRKAVPRPLVKKANKTKESSSKSKETLKSKSLLLSTPPLKPLVIDHTIDAGTQSSSDIHGADPLATSITVSTHKVATPNHDTFQVTESGDVAIPTSKDASMVKPLELETTVQVVATTDTTSLCSIGLQLGRKSSRRNESLSRTAVTKSNLLPPQSTMESPAATGEDATEMEDETYYALPPPPTSALASLEEAQSHSSAAPETMTKNLVQAKLSKPANVKTAAVTTTTIQPRSAPTTTTAAPLSHPIAGKRRSANDNFVRLNLRNSAGACRGARNKKSKWRGKFSKYNHHQDGFHKANNDQDSDDDSEIQMPKATTGSNHGQAYVSRMTGLDPMDDYLDGVYFGDKTGAKTKKNPSTKKKDASLVETTAVPLCTRHQRPCKLIVVKKNTKGNKGRKFYACSLPRGEQCDHFEWAEDTLQAARQVVADNSSHSSFIARQVAAHVDRFKNLTVPELRDEAARRRLNKKGNKPQLLMRLALWARDEIASAVPYPDDDDEKDNFDNVTTTQTAKGEEAAEIELLGSDDSDSDEDSSDDDSSEEELELFGDKDMHVDKNGIDSKMEDNEKGSIAMEDDSDDDASSKLLKTLKSVFGHKQFRDGQQWAIERCLSGKKSLLVAPTGFGKSLCYALPAALMDGVCVVVSPLISLIQDQLRSLPPRIPAATLSGSISAAATAAIIDDIVRKRIKLLFVSPERLTSPSFRRLFATKWNPETQRQERKFPEISLLCIDEAHCVSQWAHNFRPCFLRFKGLLRLMQPKSVLAVTATAGPRVIQDISHTLGIAKQDCEDDCENPLDNENILVIDKARDNIDVSCEFVAHHEERLDMLSKILKPKSSGKRSDKCRYTGLLAKGSVIVYVWRQRDTEVVAESLTAAGVNGGVVMYHGGMDASARSKAQSRFMRGKARICVATVAFGMGIDKADVEGIVHLYLSSSPEHYLQEIGRAGRDGRQARAIALPTIEEIPIRHSLVHSNYISKSQIRALLHGMKRFVIDSTTREGIHSLNVALPAEVLVLECDCKVETIETLLSILEQHGGDNPLLHVEGFNYNHATIALKKRSLTRLAEKEPIAACILKVATCLEPPIGEEKEDQVGSSNPRGFQRQFLAYSQGSYEFSVAKCANALGPSAEPRHVFAALRRLQYMGELELALDTSNMGRVILVKISEKGCSFFTSPDFEACAENLIDTLHESFTASIRSGAGKVLDINHILDLVCTAGKVDDGEPVQLPSGKSQSLRKFQELMGAYFNQGLAEETDKESRRILPETFFKVRHRELENDMFALMRDLPVLAKQAPSGSENTPILGDSNFLDYTAVATAKFLHGLDSARAPAQAFRTHPLFGKWREVQFSFLLEAIGKVLHVPNKSGS